MRYRLALFLILECALFGSLLLWARSFAAPEDCALISYFSPPEPPISRLEGISQ